MEQRTIITDALDLVGTDSSVAAWQELGRDYGAKGALLGAFIDVFAGRNTRAAKDIQLARKIMKAAGIGLEPSRLKTVELDDLSSRVWFGDDGEYNVDLTPRSGQRRTDGFGDTPNSGSLFDPSVPRSRGPLPTQRRDRDSRVKRVGVIQPPGKADGERVEPQQRSSIQQNYVETRGSSNVFAFTYDDVEQVLYVTFKAPGTTKDKRTGVSICSGREHSWYARPHNEGMTYKYGSPANPIAKEFYLEMKSAVNSSVGQFVWDRIRACGEAGGIEYVEKGIPNPVAGTPKAAYSRSSEGFKVDTVPQITKGRASQNGFY